MAFNLRDISNTLEARVDQIVADDLIDRTITARISSVTAGPSKRQPLDVHLDGFPLPWRPCLTMRRVLSGLWTADATAWKGHTVRLYRDPTARSPDSGKQVGGVRMSHADVQRRMTVSVTIRRGVKGDWVIMPLPTDDVDLDALLADAGLEIKDVDWWRKSIGKGPISELTDEQRATFAAWLAKNQKKIDDIRGMIPPEDES